MNRSPLNGRRTPLERRKGLDTSGGGTLRRRTPLPRTAGIAQTAPSPRRQRKAALDVPTEARELLALRSRGVCEALIFDVCTQRPGDVHHRKRRRDGGHALSNLVHLCRPCHSWVHAHPAEARGLGLIVSAFAEPADVPLRLLSRLTGRRDAVYLDDVGGIVIDDGLVLHVDGTLGGTR